MIDDYACRAALQAGFWTGALTVVALYLTYRAMGVLVDIYFKRRDK